MIVANRRSFLAGLVSACAAPAIVTSSGFRAGIFLPRCHERWLAIYDGTVDRFCVRADFAKRELATPPGVRVVPRHLVERIKAAIPATVDECARRVMRPGFQQHCLDWTISALRAGDWHETSIEVSIERALLQIAPGVRGGIG